MANEFALGKTTVEIRFAYSDDKYALTSIIPRIVGKITNIVGISRKNATVIDLAVTNYGGVFYYGLEREFSELEISFDGASVGRTFQREKILNNLCCGRRVSVIIKYDGTRSITLDGVITRLDFPLFQKGLKYSIKIELEKEVTF